QYNASDAFLKLAPYPNPYNPQLPIYLFLGNSNQAVQNFIRENYAGDLLRLVGWSWGYEVRQAEEVKVSGYFNNDTWQLDEQTHFDFTGKNDTILQTDHFRFIAHRVPLSKERIATIAQNCEQTYANIKDFTGFHKKLPKIDYHFHATVENKALQLSDMNEASLNHDAYRADVVMNDNFQGNLLHPENKLLLRQALGTPQLRFLEEGFSNYFTENWQKKGYTHWTQKLHQSGNLPPLKVLINNKLYQDESYLVMGAMAGSFVNFLLQHVGKDDFLKNYKSWQFDNLIGLEKDWNTYLNQLEVDGTDEIATAKKELPYLQGFNFAHEGYRIYNGYGSQLAKKSLQKLEQIGSNAVAIVPYSYMRDPEKPSYIPIIQSTGAENDQAVLFSHFEAKKLGMTTMLNPQIWVGSSWPGDIKMNSSEDWGTFFDNYYRWSRHYALLAEINQFDSYCIGVEFAKATLAKEKEWRQLIQKIRGLYSGQLTYAANWGDEFENLTFWDELDFIGLNCYYPLSKDDHPSKRALTKSFNKTLDKIERFCKKYNKPLVFTEIGFRSVEAPWKNPHAEEGDRSFNGAHQKICYEVVLKNIKNRDWCNGILWWKWPSYPSYRGPRNKGFTPSDKPAEQIVEQYFKTKN
ncbi:MAG: hypothetical protein AAGJ18_24255, partial [Bacteroidota bacterium]